MKTVRIKSCIDSFEANIIKGKLENEGIECFLTNENLSTLLPHHFMSEISGVQVLVDEENVEKALEILKENLEN